MAKYNFRITYRRGSKNARADALSRRTDYIGKTVRKETLFREGDDYLEYQGEIAATLTVIEDDTIERKIKEAYPRDARATKAMLGDSNTFYMDDDGIIRFRGVVYLPARLREEFVKQIHESPTVGYMGIMRTRDHVVAKYYFPSIIRTVERVIRDCDVCQRTKTGGHKLYGLLMSPDTLSTPWASIAMDFIVKLPPSTDPLTGVEYDSI